MKLTVNWKELMKQLWTAIKPVLLGTMADYDIVEPRNLQDLRHERTVLSMMPRIESEGYSSARECNAEMSVDAVPGGIVCMARGRLTNTGDERSAAYVLKSRIDESAFAVSGSCETNAFFVLPVVALATDCVDVKDGRVSVRRGGCDVAVESDLAFELVRTDRGDRTFSPVAGFLYAYLKAALAAGREFTVRLSVNTPKGFRK